MLHNAAWSGKKWHDQFVTGELRKRLLGEVNILKPPYSNRYPELVTIFKTSPKGGVNTFRNNLMIRSEQPAGKNLTLEGNVVSNADPGFLDEGKDDYRLKSDAEVLRALPSLGKLPVKQMGLPTAHASNFWRFLSRNSASTTEN